MKLHLVRTALAALLFFNGSLLPAAEPARAAEWPEFHGPNRDNISTEKGLLKKWPEGGPRLLRKYSNRAPCNWGVPEREMKFKTPPLPRPYSAP